MEIHGSRSSAQHPTFGSLPAAAGFHAVIIHWSDGSAGVKQQTVIIAWHKIHWFTVLFFQLSGKVMSKTWNWMGLLQHFFRQPLWVPAIIGISFHWVSLALQPCCWCWWVLPLGPFVALSRRVTWSEGDLHQPTIGHEKCGAKTVLERCNTNSRRVAVDSWPCSCNRVSNSFGKRRWCFTVPLEYGNFPLPG